MKAVVKIESYIRAQEMLNGTEKGIVVGVSGGADSMCLLCVLKEIAPKYGLKLMALHVNHGIRGESALRDEKFVESFCETNGIEYSCVHADIPKLARENGLTEEEAGRNVRYNAFLEAAEKLGYGCIAVAHNKDDNAETVLFNMFRGSGISGIRGIAPKRMLGGIRLIRPLLSTTRADIEAYMREMKVGFVTDETNLEDDYSRNRIRNNLLPYIKENINTLAAEHIAELASQAGELERFVLKLVEEKMSEMREKGFLRENEENGELQSIRIDADELLKMDSVLSKSLIRSLLGRVAGKLKDLESGHVESVAALLKKQTGKSVDLPYAMEARREYTELVIAKKKTEDTAEFSVRCSIPGVSVCPGGKLLEFEVSETIKIDAIPKNDYTKWFDYDKISNDIELRTRRTGDYILIKGSGKEKSALKRKSLKSFLVDNKISREQRDELLLLAEGSHILWIIGLRRDDSYPVTGETERILAVSLKDGISDAGNIGCVSTQLWKL